MNGPGDPHQGGYPPAPGGGYPPQPNYPPQPGYPPPGGHPGQPYPPTGYPPARKSNTGLLVFIIILLVLALIGGGAYLYFTGAFGGRSSTTTTQAAPVTPTPYTAPTATPAPVAPMPTGGDLETRLQQAVAQFQPRLPLRSGPATITSLTASGNTMYMEMELDQELSEAEWAQMGPAMRTSICGGPFSNVVRMGGGASISITAPSGDSRSFTVSTC